MKRTKLMKLRWFDVLKVQCWKIDFAITPCFLFLTLSVELPLAGLVGVSPAQPTGATILPHRTIAHPRNRLAQPTVRNENI